MKLIIAVVKPFKLDDVRDGTLVSESAPGGTVKRAVWKGGVLEPLSF